MWNLAEPVTVSFVCELQLLAGLPTEPASMVVGSLFMSLIEAQQCIVQHNDRLCGGKVLLHVTLNSGPSSRLFGAKLGIPALVRSQLSIAHS